jgi:hypothetical protein
MDFSGGAGGLLFSLEKSTTMLVSVARVRGPAALYNTVTEALIMNWGVSRREEGSLMN